MTNAQAGPGPRSRMRAAMSAQMEAKASLNRHRERGIFYEDELLHHANAAPHPPCASIEGDGTGLPSSAYPTTVLDFDQTRQASTTSRCTSQNQPRRSASRSSWFKKAVQATAAAAAVLMTTAAVTGAEAGAPNNVTSLAGTWSTGSGRVLTGLSFYNPGNGSFNPPATAGQSYSFTDDGFWEQALYLYESNPANPACVEAQLIWQHGTYVRNSNNSLTLTPFKGDGKQQISSRCAATSNTVSAYTQTEYMQGFEIHLNTHYNKPAYSLQLYEFDGTPKPLMWQRYDPPQMLPTAQLHMEIIGDTAGR